MPSENLIIIDLTPLYIPPEAFAGDVRPEIEEILIILPNSLSNMPDKKECVSVTTEVESTFTKSTCSLRLILSKVFKSPYPALLTKISTLKSLEIQ